MLNVGIVGNGFVGKAVSYGFNTKNVEQYIVDPNGGLDIKELPSKEMHVTFVCVPTPMEDDGSINATIVTDVLEYLTKNVSGLIVLKSTVTADIVEYFAQLSGRFVYNPELLTERNAKDDFTNPKFHIFGGETWACEQLDSIYDIDSICKDCPVHYVSAKEASFIKYGINSFLASKVAWMNEFYDLVKTLDCDWESVSNGLRMDPRIGSSHMDIPGPDGTYGFSGPCFPKDVAALYVLSKDSNSELNILKQVIKSNQAVRETQKTDDRAKEQNISFKLDL